MRKRFLAAAGMVAAVWSMSSAATSYSVVCNSCTLQQTRQLVQGSRPGDYFVHDMVNRQITHWSIVGTDPDTQRMTSVPITAAVQNEFNEIQNFYNQMGTLDPVWQTNASAATVQVQANALHLSAQVRTEAATANTAVGGALSAYDTINTPANQNSAIAAATSWGTWGGASQNFKAIAAEFVSNAVIAQAMYPVPVVISQELDFSDGSSIQIHFDLLTSSWVYTQGSAKDSSGNPIPENPDQAVGGTIGNQRYVWYSTPGGINDALRASQNFNNLGLPVGVPVIRYGGSWTVACTRVGGPDGTVSCTAIAN